MRVAAAEGTIFPPAAATIASGVRLGFQSPGAARCELRL